MSVNVDLMRRTLEEIDLHPETWDQRHWFCGTGMCFGGHVVVLSGHTIAGDINGFHAVFDQHGQRVGHPWDVAQRVLGLSDEQADRLFDSLSTRPRLERLCREFAEADGQEW